MKSVLAIFDILIAIVIMFAAPALWAYSEYDEAKSDATRAIVSAFSEKISKNGYITEEDYLEFTSALAKTGNVYDIKLMHRQHVYEPEYAINPALPALPASFTGQVYDYDLEAYEEDIFQYWRETETKLGHALPYFMDIDDEFSVNVVEQGQKGFLHFMMIQFGGLKDFYYEQETISNKGPLYYDANSYDLT